MKKLSTLSFSLILVIALISCNSKKKESIANILKMESSLLKDTVGLNGKLAKELLTAYIAFADQYPKDTLAPIYIFKAADISMNSNQPEQAVNYFNRVLKEYPDFRRVADCIFMKAFLYENVMKNYQKAKELYLEFLQKYPHHELADDAQNSLKNLGKTPEQLIEEFEKQNETASTQGK